MEPHKVKWSYSGLKDFETCKRKYYEVKVLKKYPREETDATIYGTRLHEQAELFIRDGRPLDDEFKFLQPVLDSLAAMPGRKMPELEMALKHDLTPCPFDSDAYWVRGIADLVIVDEEKGTARVYDFKSGSDRYPDTDQLTLMSLLVFKHFPHINKVTSGLLFVLKNSIVKHKVVREQETALWWRYRDRVTDIAMAHATGVWNPTQSGLCRKFCPVVHCPHNGRN